MINSRGIALIISLLLLSPIIHAETPAQTLYLLGYDIPDKQRSEVVEADIIAFGDYQQKRINTTLSDKYIVPTPPSKRRDFPYFNTHDLTLCDLNKVDACFDDMDSNSEVYEKSLQTLAPVFADIERLRRSDASELTSVFPDNLQLYQIPIPNYQLISKPLLTQSVLTYYQNPQAGLAQICENVAFGKKLIASQQNAIQSMIGTQVVNNHLELLEHTDKSLPLPTHCQEALQPLPVRDIAVCPLVKADAKQLENLIIGLPEIPVIFSHRATVKQINEDTKPYCARHWYEQVANDEYTEFPFEGLYEPKVFNRQGMMLINIAKIDYSTYQHKLQDTNAHLKLSQMAMHPQCLNAVNQPDVFDHLYTDKPDRNDALSDFLTSLRASIATIRALRIDDQQRLTITAYDQSNYKKVTGTVEDLTFIRASCRTVQ